MTVVRRFSHPAKRPDDRRLYAVRLALVGARTGNGPEGCERLPEAPDGTITIALGNGRTTVIDAADAPLVAQYTWWVHRSNVLEYVRGVRRPAGKRARNAVRLHRLLMDARPGQLVDHINRDPMDNRRANLRFVTHSESNLNKGPRAPRAATHSGAGDSDRPLSQPELLERVAFPPAAAPPPSSGVAATNSRSDLRAGHRHPGVAGQRGGLTTSTRGLTPPGT